MRTTWTSFRSLLALAGGLGAAAGSGWADEPAADRLGGSLGGLRPVLATAGLTTGLDYTAEIFSVARGGLHRGSEFEGLGNLTLDHASAESRPGAAFAFHANVFATHGDSISDAQAGDASHLSNIDYQDAVRLFECWGEWSWADAGWSIRAGQLALDAEFAVVEPAAVFCNSDFGAAGAMSANVPIPIYAIAAPGLRLKYSRGDAYVQAAVFDGNPDPSTLGDPSPDATDTGRTNRAGIAWRLASDEGALVVIEAGVARGEHRDWGVHAGAFYHTDTFSDQRFDRAGRRLSDPASDGVPRGRCGDFGAYAVGVRTLWREASASVDGFARVAVVPGDRNLIGASWETGVAGTGLVPGRPDDVLALGIGSLAWSGPARDAVRDDPAHDPAAVPDEEIVVELTWRMQLRPAWALQPDLQWIRHPGGSAAIADVLAVGLRTSLSF